MVVAPATADLLAEPRTVAPTTCSTAHPADRARVRSCSRRRCTPRCGSTRATQDNVATLRRRGALVLEPAVGRLTGKDTGPGRLPEPAQIFEFAVDVLARGAGRPSGRLRRSARGRVGRRHPGVPRPGPLPRQPLVRASRATRSPRPPLARGAEVTLVAANVALPDPAGVTVSTRRSPPPNSTTRCASRERGADAVVMAAAPADFRPANAVDHKIKKRADGSGPDDRAGREPRHPGRARGGRGAAASAPSWSASPPRPATPTAAVLDHARAKLARKGCDLLVVNDVSGGGVFGADDNQAVILGADGDRDQAVPRDRSATWRTSIWDHVASDLGRSPGAPAAETRI